MKKIFKIGLLYSKLNMQRDFFYRFNAVMTLTSAMAYFITFILANKYTFNSIDSIKGYNEDQILLTILLGQIFFYLYVITTRKNWVVIADSINKGKLDFYLLKPIKLIRLIPFLQIDFRHILPFVINFVYLVVRIDLSIANFLSWFLAFLFLLNGVYIQYNVCKIGTSLSFWKGRNTSIFDFQMEMPVIVRLPFEFFGIFMGGLFTFVFPLTVVLGPSFQIIFGNINIWFLIWAVLFSLIIKIISDIVWKKGLENYESAN